MAENVGAAVLKLQADEATKHDVYKILKSIHESGNFRSSCSSIGLLSTSRTVHERKVMCLHMAAIYLSKFEPYWEGDPKFMFPLAAEAALLFGATPMVKWGVNYDPRTALRSNKRKRKSVSVESVVVSQLLCDRLRALEGVWAVSNTVIAESPTQVHGIA